MSRTTKKKVASLIDAEQSIEGHSESQKLTLILEGLKRNMKRLEAFLDRIAKLIDSLNERLTKIIERISKDESIIEKNLRSETKQASLPPEDPIFSEEEGEDIAVYSKPLTSQVVAMLGYLANDKPLVRREYNEEVEKKRWSELAEVLNKIGREAGIVRSSKAWWKNWSSYKKKAKQALNEYEAGLVDGMTIYSYWILQILDIPVTPRTDGPALAFEAERRDSLVDETTRDGTTASGVADDELSSDQTVIHVVRHNSSNTLTPSEGSGNPGERRVVSADVHHAANSIVAGSAVRRFLSDEGFAARNGDIVSSTVLTNAETQEFFDEDHELSFIGK